jgi:hypothetical protein
MSSPRRVASLLLALAPLTLASPAVHATGQVPWLVSPAAALVRLGTGLPLDRPVPVEELTAEAARAFMAQDFTEDTQGVDLVGQGTLLSATGFLPAGTNLAQAYLDFMGDQAAAFYSPKTGRFYNVSRYGPLDALGESVTVAHELTHAAQDQAVNLQRELERRLDDDDQARALQWALEGQATLVGNRVGGFLGPPLPGPLGIPWGEAQTALLWTPLGARLVDFAVRQSASSPPPPFIADQVMTAYVRGSRFAWQVERRLGRAAHKRLVCRPPRSTEETLHVAKYLRGDDPPLVVAVDPPPGRAVRVSLTAGEWALGWLLARGALGERGPLAAQGWGGDRMALLDDGTVVWRVVMDTHGHAGRLHWALASVSPPAGVAWHLGQVGREVHLVAGGTPQQARTLSDALARGPVQPLPDVEPPRQGFCAGR